MSAYTMELSEAQTAPRPVSDPLAVGREKRLNRTIVRSYYKPGIQGIQSAQVKPFHCTVDKPAPIRRYCEILIGLLSLRQLVFKLHHSGRFRCPEVPDSRARKDNATNGGYPWQRLSHYCPGFFRGNRPFGHSGWIRLDQFQYEPHIPDIPVTFPEILLQTMGK